MPRTDYEQMLQVYQQAGGQPQAFADSDVAHLVIHGNEVVGAHTVPGLRVEPHPTDTGVRIHMALEQGTRLERQVHLCFGVLPEKGLQEIELEVDIEERAAASILAHCVFPNATDVTHNMQANIRVGAEASYEYVERHVHSEGGGVHVVPKAQVAIEEGARMRTDFDLLQGRVGKIELDYAIRCAAHSSLEMVARINGYGDDAIRIREAASLEGEEARAVLKSRVAVRQRASAEIINELTASAPGARGHVDCKEIVQGQARANAVPIVTVSHPLAHVTHEAAIGRVDDRQLLTLMARGLSEDEAVETIIQGLLS
ncbi:MAG: SufB/SufD family protein [Candidatus Brocadiia bacterium]